MVEPATVTITIAALRKPLEDIYLASKGVVKSKLRHLQAEARVKQVHKAISSVQKVKTLWQIDKETKLLTFYYPSKVIIAKQPKRIESLAELSTTENIVLQGTVGQGKSIFLRYLCLKELTVSKRLPIFVELRRYDAKTTFKDFLIAGVGLYHIPCDEEVFDYLADSGRLVLLLDAFDEIDPDLVTPVVNQLEMLVQAHPNVQLVITSRPDSGIERSPHFRVYQLAPLLPEDHKPFLEKIASDEKQALDTLGAIQKCSHDIRSLLTTPLLMTLLVIVYNSTQEIPASLSEFYEALFQTLLTRHDKTKPGFRRKRETQLSNSELKRVFEAFCYAARQEGLLVLPEDRFAELSDRAAKVAGFSCGSDAFANDITKVACLMQQEGFQYHFIHKSVVEFHAACFVAKTSQDNAIRFYSALQSDKWMKWRQELEFLSQIDRARYLEYFYLPSATAALNALRLADGQVQSFEDIARRLLNGLGVTVSRPKSGAKTDSARLQRYSFRLVSFGGFVAHTLLLDVFNKTVGVRSSEFKGLDHHKVAPLGDVLADNSMLPEAARVTRRMVTDIRSAIQSAQEELALQTRIAEFVNP